MRRTNLARWTAFGALGLAAAVAVAEELVVLESGAQRGLLVRTDSAVKPGVVYGTVVKGLEVDESVLAIDSVGGVDGRLYGLTQKRLYAIDQNTGQATAVGPRFARGSFSGARVPDLEINPASGLGFIVGPDRKSSGAKGITGSVDPRTGRLTMFDADGAPARKFVYAEGDPGFGTTPDVCGVACTSDIDGPNSWTMFGVDRARGALVRIGSLGGLQSATDDRDVATTVAPITGLADGAYPVAFEIGPTGIAYVVAEVDVGVYQVDLTTGVATLKRSLGLGIVRDAAVLQSSPPLPPLPLRVTKAVVRYDFRPSRTGAGSMAVTGAMPYPEGGVAGRVVQVDLDGVVREFTTDSRGRAKSGPDLFRFVGRPRDGQIRFAITIRKAALDEVAGVDSRTATGPRSMTLDLFLDDRAYRSRIDVDYFAGRFRGVAKR